MSGFEIKKISKPVVQSQDRKVASIFQKGNDADNDNALKQGKKPIFNNNIMIMTAEKSKMKMAEEVSKNLMEDPTIYDYDSVHDQIENRRKAIQEVKKTSNQGPRYIQNIINATEKRKREQSLIYEKIAEKELKREGANLPSERFVTASYLKMMEENKKFEEEDEKLEDYNRKHTAEAQKDLSGLYKTLYSQNIFSGGHRPDLSSNVAVLEAKLKSMPTNEPLNTNINVRKTQESSQTKSTHLTGHLSDLKHEQTLDITTTSSSKVETHVEKTTDLNEMENQSSIQPLLSTASDTKKIHLESDNTKLMKKVSRSRSRSKEKVSREEIPAESTKKEELSKEDKLRLAKERYLQRKKGVLEAPSQ